MPLADAFTSAGCAPPRAASDQALVTNLFRKFAAASTTSHGTALYAITAPSSNASYRLIACEMDPLDGFNP